MIRRIARELIVQSLFQIDFSGCTAEEALNAAVEEQNSKDAVKAQNYAQVAINGILNDKAGIDAKIKEYSIVYGKPNSNKLVNAFLKRRGLKG